MSDNDKPITKKVLIETLNDFFTKMILPQFERIDAHFDVHDQELKEIKEDIEIMDRKLDKVVEKVTDHDKQISKLKAVFAS